MVEGVALGRRVIGFDISALACFITRAKTTPLSSRDEVDAVLPRPPAGLGDGELRGVDHVAPDAAVRPRRRRVDRQVVARDASAGPGDPTLINLAGEGTREGVEVSAKLQLMPGLAIGLAYTYTDARNEETGELLLPAVRQPIYFGQNQREGSY